MGSSPSFVSNGSQGRSIKRFTIQDVDAIKVVIDESTTILILPYLLHFSALLHEI